MIVKMSRAFCYQCHRAKVACLCDRIDKQHNQVKVIVLQHPDETSQAKGSAIIAELGLQQYACWVGEDFTQHDELKSLMKNHASHTAILYPAEQSVELQTDRPVAVQEIDTLLVIDATWRKARKIWQLNPQLHTLQCLRLSPEAPSQYRIRKVPGDTYLSTVESIVEALRLLENRPQRYQPLLDLFAQMIDFQIEQMGMETFTRHHGDDGCG